VQHGTTDLPQSLGNREMFNARDDAMALPMVQPARRFVPTVVFGQVKRPETMVAKVRDDAPEQTPGIGVRCFNQQGDLDWRFQRTARHQRRAGSGMSVLDSKAGADAGP